jgi:hypothetical protein
MAQNTTVNISQKPVVASLVWDLPSQLHEIQAEVVQQLGYSHRFFHFDEGIPSDADILLVQGPYGSLLPLARQLVDYSPQRRPVLAYWFQQSLDMLRPEWMRVSFARKFSDLHRYHREAGWLGYVLDRLVPNIVSSKGARLRFLGDILWLHRHGLLDVLALSSSVYAEYLKQQYGIHSILIPRGYHPSYGRLLDLDRDIAVVWMGKTRTERRKRVISWLREQLAKRGQVMRIHDGQENDLIFGEKRTRILNRARFVLNVFPHPTWELSIRYFLAATNGAVVLTEPGENRYPFVPGKHLVECAIEGMPDTVMYYLDHEEERCAIANGMINLMKRELTLEHSIANILVDAEKVLECRRRQFT